MQGGAEILAATEMCVVLAAAFALCLGCMALARRSWRHLLAGVGLVCAAALLLGAAVEPAWCAGCIPLRQNGPDEFEGILAWQIVAAALLAGAAALFFARRRALYRRAALACSVLVCFVILSIRVGGLERRPDGTGAVAADVPAGAPRDGGR